MCLTSELDEITLGLVQLCPEQPEEQRFHRHLIPQSFCEMLSSLGQYNYNFCVSFLLELFFNKLHGVTTCT